MCKDPLTQGTVLTIMTGGSVTGSFALLPENRALLTGGYLFRLSHLGNNVSLTVMPGRRLRRRPGKQNDKVTGENAVAQITINAPAR